MFDRASEPETECEASRRASVLDCGDGVFGVAALGRGRCVGDELPDLERNQSQSGDFTDSVTAVQNLAADSTVLRTQPPSCRSVSTAPNSACSLRHTRCRLSVYLLRKRKGPTVSQKN